MIIRSCPLCPVVAVADRCIQRIQSSLPSLWNRREQKCFLILQTYVCIQITISPNPLSSLPFEKLIIAQLEKNSYFYGTRNCDHVLNDPPRVLISSQLNPIYALTPYLFNIYFNIILPLTPTSLKWSFPLRFPYVLFPTHFILLDLITQRPFSHWGDVTAIRSRKKVDFHGESSSHSGHTSGRSAIKNWRFDQ
jgi:hypothetical protein